jgi:hypothetical protein
MMGALLVAACGGPGVNSNDDARRAYLGLDASIDKAIQLGFDGFNSPSTGANIAPQMTTGVKSGTLTVTGTVDQGASTNKNMTLAEAMAKYSDDGMITYDTSPTAMPVLGMSLKGIPTGTLSGSLSGAFNMTGQLIGTVTLALTFTGDLQAGTGGAMVERKPGTTHITGTATSGNGVYQVDVTR